MRLDHELAREVILPYSVLAAHITNQSLFVLNTLICQKLNPPLVSKDILMNLPPSRKKIV
jgi:hypothetical protein